MPLTLLGHPFSAFCQKVQIALYENGIPFEYRTVTPHGPELTAHWPIGRIPVLLDGETPVAESSIIIEHLMLSHPGPVRLIPAEPRAALEARRLDRIFDTYVAMPMQKIVTDKLRPEGASDPHGVAGARRTLDTIYAWLDGVMASRHWAIGEAFTLADCAAAPALLYADWAHPIPEGCAALRAYRARLLARPSVARAVDEARPYRPLFPLGAPERD